MLSKILAGLLAFISAVALIFKSKYENERSERSEEEVERLESVNETQDKATEALVKGLENESKPVNGRTHDFND